MWPKDCCCLKNTASSPQTPPPFMEEREALELSLRRVRRTTSTVIARSRRSLRRSNPLRCKEWIASLRSQWRYCKFLRFARNDDFKMLAMTISNVFFSANEARRKHKGITLSSHPLLHLISRSHNHVGWIRSLNQSILIFKKGICAIFMRKAATWPRFWPRF